MVPTPAALLRKLSLPSTKGGKQGEVEYRQFHVAYGAQPLKKKYRG